jgi:hypothetical protein
MPSLAALVIDTVAELRKGLSAYGADAGRVDATVTQVTFSLAYDPGQEGTPLPLPPAAGRIPVMTLAGATRHLVRHDRDVRLSEPELRAAPRNRVARLELTIDLAGDAGPGG